MCREDYNIMQNYAFVNQKLQGNLPENDAKNLKGEA